MAMHFDKELVNPNMPRTIRFTPILFEWLAKVAERENCPLIRWYYSAEKIAWQKIMTGT